MRFRTRIFCYLSLGIIALIGLLFKEQKLEVVEILTQKIQPDINYVSSMTPKFFQESSSKVEKSMTIGEPVMVPKVTKSTTESIEEKAVIKAFFGPNMTKEAVKEWQMQHVTREPIDFNPSKKMPTKEMRRNILILTPSEKSIVTTILMNFPGSLIFHQLSEETDTTLAENLFDCDITANNATFDFYSEMDKTWSFQYENYCRSRSKLSTVECHKSVHFKALCPYFPIKVFKLNQRLSVAKKLLKKMPDLKIIVEIADPRIDVACEDEKFPELCEKQCDGLNQDYNEALALGKTSPSSITVIRGFDVLLYPMKSTIALSQFLNLPLMNPDMELKAENEEFSDEEELHDGESSPDMPDYHKIHLAPKNDITWSEKLCSDILTKVGFAKFNGPKNLTLPEMLVKSPIEVWPF